MEEIKSLKDREKELLEVGKKQGYITYEVLAEHLKGLDIDADSLDELYNLLIENHIDIITDDNETSGGAKAKEEAVVLSDEEFSLLLAQINKLIEANMNKEMNKNRKNRELYIISAPVEERVWRKQFYFQ